MQNHSGKRAARETVPLSFCFVGDPTFVGITWIDTHRGGYGNDSSGKCVYTPPPPMYNVKANNRSQR